MEINKIYNEDCRYTMLRMKDKSVDLVLTSPPYNMNLRIRNGKYCSRQIVKEISTKYEEFSDNLPIDEFYAQHSLILKELIRVSKIVFYNIQVVTGSKRAFFKMIGKFSDNLKEIIIWDKVNAEPAMHHGVLNRQSELILVFQDPGQAIKRQFDVYNSNRGIMTDVWQIKRGKKAMAGLGASFPENLAEKIILNFSNKGDLIYDPFMGSGTTGRVAKINNRFYLGSEISDKYCDFATNRINQNIKFTEPAE